MTTSEIAKTAGQWKLDGFYSGGYTNYDFDAANPSCQLSNVWLYNSLYPDGRHGSISISNGNYGGCGSHSLFDLAAQAAYGGIGFESWPNFSGEQIEFYSNYDSDPFTLNRNAYNYLTTQVQVSYSVGFSGDLQYMYWYEVGMNRFLIWKRATGGPAIP
jgi:hypothetical protein